MNPNALRINDKALAIIKAAICHGSSTTGHGCSSKRAVKRARSDVGHFHTNRRRQCRGRRGRSVIPAPGDLEAFFAKIVEVESERAAERAHRRSHAGLIAASFYR